MGENLDLFGDAPSAENIAAEPSARSTSKKTSKRKSREKAEHAYRTISEVAGDLDVATHVLRFWETRFSEVKPMKRAGGRRYYRPQDVELLHRIKGLLYDDGYTIRGVQTHLKKQGKATAPKMSAKVEKKSDSSRMPQDMVQALVSELKDMRSILTA